MAEDIKHTVPTKPLTERESIAAIQDWHVKVAAPNPKHSLVGAPVKKKVEAPKQPEAKK